MRSLDLRSGKTTPESGRIVARESGVARARERSSARAVASSPASALGNQGLLRLARGAFLQSRLAVSQPGDPLELEADRVADEVMRMPAPTNAIPAAPAAQRGEVANHCGTDLDRVEPSAAISLARKSPNEPSLDALDALNPLRMPRYVDNLFDSVSYALSGTFVFHWQDGATAKTVSIPLGQVNQDDSLSYVALFKVHPSKAEALQTVLKWSNEHPGFVWYSFYTGPGNVIMPTTFSAASTPEFHKLWPALKKDLAATAEDTRKGLAQLGNAINPIPGTELDEDGNLHLTANPLAWLPLLLHYHAIKSGRPSLPKLVDEPAGSGKVTSADPARAAGTREGMAGAPRVNDPVKGSPHDSAAPGSSSAASVEEAAVHTAASRAHSEVKLGDGSTHGIAPYHEGATQGIRFCSSQCSLVADKLEQIENALPNGYNPKLVREIEFLKNQVRGVDKALEAGLKSGKLQQMNVDAYSAEVAAEIQKWAKSDPNIDHMLQMSPDELKAFRVHAEVHEQFEMLQEGARSANVKGPEGKTSTSALERDVLDELGIKDLKNAKQTPGGKPQPIAFEVGNFGHAYAEELVAGLPHGCDKEVVIDLGEGVTRRADRVFWNNKGVRGSGGIVFEIKPNTGDWSRLGREQAQLYAHYMQQQYGGTWRAVCLTYDAAQVRALLGH